MALALLMALQAATPDPAPTPAPQAIVPIDFDLADVREMDFSLSRRCAQQEGEEIVVCGIRTRGGGYDIEAWERVFREGPLVAETRIIGNLSARAFVESAPMQQGLESTRVMVGIRLPF